MREKKPFIITIIVGSILMGIGVVTKIDYYSNLIFAIGFGILSSAVVQMLRISYWQTPKHQTEYERKKKEAYINCKDERKQCIREKAGMITYQIMTVLLLFLTFLLALFRVEAWIIGMVYLLFLLQWGIGVIAVRILEKRM